METDTGKIGEEKSEEYLKSKGYRILARNFRTREGELDIVAEDGDELVIVEVKTRKSRNFGAPEEYVDRRKMEKIKKASFEYLSENPHANWRIDVISLVKNGDEYGIEHFENITAD